MIYTVYLLFFVLFIIVSFWMYKRLLQLTDVMKYMFHVLAYITAILILFQVLEKLMLHFFSPVSEKELTFMTLMYLFGTMIAFLGIAIVSIKKIRKK